MPPPKAHWTTHLKAAPKKRGQMNKLESRYSSYLAMRKLAGEILWAEYEAITLRLTDPTPGKPAARYTPDFVVMAGDGTLELHEVKGHWTEASRLRVKMAADRFPFVFVGVTETKDGWQFEPF